MNDDDAAIQIKKHAIDVEKQLSERKSRLRGQKDKFSLIRSKKTSFFLHPQLIIMTSPLLLQNRLSSSSASAEVI